VLHGTTPAIIDFSNAIAGLGIDVTRFGTGEAEFDRLLRTVAERLVALNRSGRVPEANIRSVQLLGKNYREYGEILEQVVRTGNLAALKAELQASGQLVTPEDAKRNREYAASLN
jgi:hypothetical protein